ncbi:MAG TPA: hypothetical protein ENH85_11175 [Candidatus Scalindua sp.]|nr:hypothetical protein [Candidatus Scalindua sp.]
MIIRIIILSFILIVGNIGCKPFTTTTILSGLGTMGGVITGINKYNLVKRGLDLEERKIALKEKKFEMEKATIQ